jgi:hypothetical protein
LTRPLTNSPLKPQRRTIHRSFIITISTITISSHNHQHRRRTTKLSHRKEEGKVKIDLFNNKKNSPKNMCKPDPTEDGGNAPVADASGTKDANATDTATAVPIDAPANDDDAVEVDIKDIDTLSVEKEDVDEKEKEQPDVGCCRRSLTRVMEFYWTYEVLVLIVIAICIARAYPPLGAVYLQPDITATWLAICFIFLVAGLVLKTEEFSKAFQRIWFNLFVQCFNFLVCSSTVYGMSRLLSYTDVLSQKLADGMVVAASLPMTINMVSRETKRK